MTSITRNRSSDPHIPRAGHGRSDTTTPLNGPAAPTDRPRTEEMVSPAEDHGAFRSRFQKPGLPTRLQQGGVQPFNAGGLTLYGARLRGSAVDASMGAHALDQVVLDAFKTTTAQARDVMDRLVAARASFPEGGGLLPLHVHTENGEVVTSDGIVAGLDMGRQTAGLVMLSQIAKATGDNVGAEQYLTLAKENYARGKEFLARDDFFLQRRDLRGDQIQVGEPEKSAPGEDNMSRVNPRAYAIRAAAELYRATNDETYLTDLKKYLAAWIRDFHDPANGGFFIHANVDNPQDHKELNPIKEKGGVDSTYDNTQGVKGNDGTIYALSSILLPANEILKTPETQKLVREQMDLILDRFHRANGMLWENYTHDWKPISVDWQNQALDAPEGQAAVTSHVAIGGHTAMAGQQIIEGARQLRDQGVLSKGEYQRYIDRTVALFQEFATTSGAVDWNTGAVHNGIRVEEPVMEKRRIPGWGDAGWQQAELIQTLLRLKEEGRLTDIQGPGGKTGADLLRLAESHYAKTYAPPADYAFQDYFGNPDVYHRPQLALYHLEASTSR